MSGTPDCVRIFRAARPADAASIRLLFLQSNLSSASADDLERVAAQSGIGESRTYVCDQDSQVVGVLQWRYLGEEAEILDLAVGQKYRRQGCASFLLTNLVQLSSKLTVQKIFLEVRESNAAAIALYTKFGFQITNRRPNYYRNPEENALLMTLPLSA